MKRVRLALPPTIIWAIIHSSLPASKLTFVGVSILPFENKIICKTRGSGGSGHYS
jgi:hypothetical protein